MGEEYLQNIVEVENVSCCFPRVRLVWEQKAARNTLQLSLWNKIARSGPNVLQLSRDQGWKKCCAAQIPPIHVHPTLQLQLEGTALFPCSPISQRILNDLPHEWYPEGGNAMGCWAMPRFGDIRTRMRREKKIVLIDPKMPTSESGLFKFPGIDCVFMDWCSSNNVTKEEPTATAMPLRGG